MSDDNDNDFDDDGRDEPYADPAIRAAYRDALGRLIMAHNEVDFWLSGILAKAVRILAPEGALDELATGDFSARAANIELLMKVAPHLCLGGVGNGRLGELNGVRNILAHGHFDQDRYSGTFEIVNRKHKSLQQRRLNNLNAVSINAHASELEDIASHMEAVFAFMESPVPAEFFDDDPVIQKSADLWEAMRAEQERRTTSRTVEPSPLTDDSQCRR